MDCSTYVCLYVHIYVCSYLCMYLFQSFHLQNKYTILLSLLISPFPFHHTSVTPRTDMAFIIQLHFQILQSSFLIGDPYIQCSNLIVIIFLLLLFAVLLAVNHTLWYFSRNTPPPQKKREFWNKKKNLSISNMWQIGYGEHSYRHYPKEEY
jgi:hypothetical protein